MDKSERQPVEIVIYNAAELVTVSHRGPGPKRGAQMDELGIIPQGALAIRQGRITAVGPSEEIMGHLETSSDTLVINASQKVVLPGFVDPHTHLVFAGSREDEFARRIAGEDYQQILAAGGGILNTMRATRTAEPQELARLAWHRLNTMLLHGTTTAEAKSGYGLNTADEIKSLEVIRQLAQHHPITLVPTFLGAHAVPPEFHGAPDAYIDHLIMETLPAVVAGGLAVYCDVFCEQGVFNVDQSRRLLAAAKASGLGVRIHADEFASIGATPLAVEMGAASADHLTALTEEDARLLATSDVVATLLPGTSFTLRHAYAPARRLIAEGVAVALATDLNPGTYMSESMSLVIALACVGMQLTPAQAIVASTLNAACALEQGDKIGGLQPGKMADIIILNIPNHKHLPYHLGINQVDTVIKAGRVVVQNSRLAPDLERPPQLFV
ncbi:MAG: imidazolonepropionase [Chloroflexi bacterium]|nr:imidazolonepropionase [Chloroflexota bacterium]MCL5075254.1 imidazolonepropionase [Chloroflexota bacterium]